MQASVILGVSSWLPGYVHLCLYSLVNLYKLTVRMFDNTQTTGLAHQSSNEPGFCLGTSAQFELVFTPMFEEATSLVCCQMYTLIYAGQLKIEDGGKKERQEG